MQQPACIDKVGGAVPRIPWNIPDPDEIDARFRQRQFVAAEQSGDEDQLIAIAQDLRDHQSGKQLLSCFWSQSGAAAAAGNLAGVLARSGGNRLTDHDGELLGTYADSLAAAFNLGELISAQSKQLTDSLAADAANDPGPVAMLLESAGNASTTMNRLATAIKDQALPHYWEPRPSGPALEQPDPGQHRAPHIRLGQAATAAPHRMASRQPSCNRPRISVLRSRR
jgi:hypothetical protein